MAKRVVLKIGDVFCAEFEDGTKAYFQYIANDYSMLNSPVIRVFNTLYAIDKNIKIDDIVNDEIAFYTHSFIRIGVRQELWYKIGKSKDLGLDKLENVIFGCTHETDNKGNFSNSIDPISNWFVWKVNKKVKRVGKLPKSHLNIVEAGSLMPDNFIKDRIKSGYYNFTANEYSVLKRKPRPDYDSFLRKETVNDIKYYHFRGENLIDSYILQKADFFKFENNPNPESLKFWDINWKAYEFINESEFNSIKNKYSLKS